MALNAFIEQLSLPAWLYDEQSNVFLVINQPALDFYGYTRETFLTLKITDIVTTSKVPNSLSSKIQQHRRADGHLLPVILTEQNLATAEGQVKLGIIQDASDQAALEAAVQAQEYLINALYENSPDCIKTLDLDGRLLYMSSNGQNALDISNIEPYLKGDWLSFWRGEDHTAALAAFAEAKAGGVGHFQGYFATLKGTPKWWDVLITPIRDASGQTKRLLAVSRDITQLRQTQLTLAESEQSLSTIFKQAPIGIAYATLDGHLSLVNDKLCEILGYAREELEQIRFQDLIQPVDLTDPPLFNTNEVPPPQYSTEKRYLRKDGTWAWVHLKISRIDSLAGQASYFILIIEDISIRKQAELRTAFLAQAGMLLAASLDYETTLSSIARLAVPDMADWCTVDLVDAEGLLRRVKVTHSNPAKETLAHELQQRFPRDPQSQQGPYQVLRTGQAILVSLITPEMIDGIKLHPDYLRVIRELGLHSYICVPLKAREKILGTLTFITAESRRCYTVEDLTFAEDLANRCALAMDNALLFQAKEQELAARHQAEAEIRSLNAGLEQRIQARTAELLNANREIEAFSYSVSHDLQAPLRAINGFSQMILEDYADRLDETARGYLQRVRRASRRMAQLIEDLLHLSRITRSEVHFQHIDLTKLVQRIVENLAQSDPARVVDVVIAPHVFAAGDPRLLLIALENLFANAWKFTKKHDQARIEFGIEHNEQGEQIYFVKDDGAGFDMRYADKLFGAFQRLHGVDEFEGTGIGLIIVQRIIQRHGGRIWAKGEVEKGATFYFTLPDNTNALEPDK